MLKEKLTDQDISRVSESKKEFSKLKLKMSLQYIFSPTAGKKIHYEELEYQYSRKTGRLKYVLDASTKKVLFSFRANGSIAPTVAGARQLLGIDELLKTRKRPRYVVTVLDGVSELVADGKTVFCKHIVSCDNNLRGNEDVVIVNESGKLLAVGRSIVAGPIMKQFKRGAAIKVREGINSRNGSIV
jgi:predicted RNA-binding protein (TIGR00451 family)